MHAITRHVIFNLIWGFLGWLVLFLAAGALRLNATNVVSMSHSGTNGPTQGGSASGITRITSIQHALPNGTPLTMPQVYVTWQFSGKYEGAEWASSPVVQFTVGPSSGPAAQSPVGVKSSSGGLQVTATLDAATGKYYVTLGGYKMNGASVVAGSQVTLKAWVDAEYKFAIKVKNDTAAPVNYKVMQDGETLDWFTLGAGEAMSKTYTTDSPSPVVVGQTPQQVFKDFTTGRSVLGGDGPTTTATTADDGTTILPIASGSGTPVQKDVTTNPGAGDSTTTQDGVLWSPDKVTQSGDLLDKTTFKQGLDSLVKAVNSSGGGGGGGTTPIDLTPVTTRIDSTNSKLDAQKTALDAHNEKVIEDMSRRKIQYDREKGLVDGTPGLAAMQQAGAAAAADATSAWGTVNLPVPAVTGSPPMFTITEPFTGKVFDMNPFRADRFGDMAAWLRQLAIWFLVVGFAVYAVHQAGDTVRDIAQARQARGNTVAGTGGQISALIAAGAITGFVLIGIVALAGWKDTVLAGSGGSILTVLGVNPFGSAPAGVVWMIDQIFPIVTALAVILAKVTFRMSATASYLTAATVIRFLVP